MAVFYDVLSPLLFSFYASDLITELISCNCRININNVNICSLGYAGDVVLMSETPEGLQKSLNVASLSSLWNKMNRALGHLCAHIG